MPIRCRCVAIPVIDLDKIVTEPVPQSYVSVEKSVQSVEENSIINKKGGTSLEQLSQARKKDHVFEITNFVIERVPVVNTPQFSKIQNNALASLHREVLRVSKLENKGAEVALVTNLSFDNPAKVLGTVNSVNYEINAEVRALKLKSYRGELIVVHNHPSTRNFSFSDAAVFVFDEYVSTLSVVTNQGQVYVLQKLNTFDYDSAQKILQELLIKYEISEYPKDEKRQAAAAKEFIKKAGKVGIWYGTSKK